MKLIFPILFISSIICGVVLGGFVFKNIRNSIYLLSPVVIPFDLSGCISEGNPDAPISIVEFSDIECPYSSKNHKVMGRLKKKYTGKVNYYFRNFPLRSHEGAPIMAKAVLAAGQQGKAGEMRDVLFGIHSFVSLEETISSIAEGIGLNAEKFNESMISEEVEGKLNAGIKDGIEHGVRSTPTVFINGYLIKGAVGLDVYSTVIDKLLLTHS